jgi:hypothetical protein
VAKILVAWWVGGTPHVGDEAPVATAEWLISECYAHGIPELIEALDPEFECPSTGGLENSIEVQFLNFPL